MDGQSRERVGVKQISVDPIPGQCTTLELASHMKHQGIKARLQWAPREANREADRLPNGDLSEFSPEVCFHLGVRSITWYISDDALSMCRDSEQAYEYANSQEHCPELRDVRSGSERLPVISVTCLSLVCISKFPRPFLMFLFWCYLRQDSVSRVTL